MKVVNSLIDNCLSVLELLATGSPWMRLSEIADRLALQRSGVHRLLSALVALGWVEQDEATGFYRLSLKLSAIGYRFIQNVNLPDIYQPVVDRVSRKAGELVRMAVLASNQLTTMAHAQGAQGSLICRSRTFPVLPLHASSSGKAWLATLPRERAIKLALDSGLGNPGRFGPREIGNVDDFLAELDRTKERGFALGLEEAEEAIGSVAAAIIPTSGQAVGALAIVAPVFRLNEQRIKELGELARSGAEELAVLWPLGSVRGSDALPGKAAA